MITLVVLAPTVPPYLSVAFPDGSSPLDRLVQRVEELRGPATETERAPVVVPVPAAGGAIPGLPADWRTIKVEDRSAGTLFRALDTALPTDADTLVCVPVDAPFVDGALTRYLAALHVSSWCDYTFADGFPEGYAGEILRRDVVGTLASLADAGGLRWTRSVLFDTLSRDINAFDVETEAAAEDFALLRASLTVDTRANYLLCRRLAERGLDTPTGADPVPDPRHERYPHDGINLLAALRDDPTVRRTVPYYYQVQITTEMSQRPPYTPWADERWAPDTPGQGTHMSVDRWRRLLEAIATETPEAVISIGYRGEPACHPDLPEILNAVDAYPGLSLYIETTGLGRTADAVAVLKSPSIAAVIVETDGLTEDQYRTLRGEGHGEAHAFIDTLRGVCPDRLYVQATRMTDNEWDLQEFFTHWDGTAGAAPLIQKYNSWAGRLPDRRVADLSPLERIPCWHLQRDLVVLVDGTVPRCFQDLDREAVRGNVFDDGVAAVWAAGEPDFDGHARGEYPRLCVGCDEYYTFNA